MLHSSPSNTSNMTGETSGKNISREDRVGDFGHSLGRVTGAN